MVSGWRGSLDFSEKTFQSRRGFEQFRCARTCQGLILLLPRFSRPRLGDPPFLSSKFYLLKLCSNRSGSIFTSFLSLFDLKNQLNTSPEQTLGYQPISAFLFNSRFTLILYYHFQIFQHRREY